MPILERIMQPLIRASEARGRAAATAELEEQFEEWKQDQIRRGAVFVEDVPRNDNASSDADSPADVG